MRTVLFFIFLIAILIPTQALAVQQQMTYLPRDEEIVHVEENYSNYVLRQTSCNVIDELSNKSSRCYACLQARQTCPDCCLRFSSDGTALASECSSALTEYTPVPALFPSKTQNPPETDTCFSEVWGLFLENPRQFCLNGQDQVPFPCQQLGCLGVQADSPETIKARPQTTPGAHCWPGGTDNGQQSWICDTDSLSDPHPDIENQDPAPEYADLSCRDLGPLFDIVPVSCGGAGGGHGNQTNTSQQNSGGGPGGGSCYKYSFKNDVLDCIRSCVDQAKRYSLYQKSRQCCLDVFTCSQMDPPGYPMNCSAETSCATRVDWPECALGADAELCCDNPSLTSQTCEGYQRQIQDCMDVTTGKCTSCFREFGPSRKKLTYEFFARSNERILILPQINMTPEFIRKTGTGGCPASNANKGTPPQTYFYMMAKVFDITGAFPVEVFPGTSGKEIISQSSFTNAFSIYFSTLVDKNNRGEPFLRQGRKYRIELFWFIPSLDDYCLSVKVHSGALSVIRLRN